MKLEELLKTKKTIEDSIVNMKTGIQKCDSTARESEGFNFFGDAVSRRNDAFFDLEHIIFRKHRELIEKYIKIVESIEELDKLLNHIKQELKLISEKKQAGDIIDISIRHDFDPNKALYDEGLKLAQNQKLIQSSPKLVLLSYRTVLLKDMANEWIKQSTQILKNINKEYIAKNLAEGLTRIADAMISFRL